MSDAKKLKPSRKLSVNSTSSFLCKIQNALYRKRRANETKQLPPMDSQIDTLSEKKRLVTKLLAPRKPRMN